MMSKEFSQEQERLNVVIETIEAQTNKLEGETEQRKKEVVHIRKHFWDDVKVNMDTFDDYLETIIGLRQQAQELSVSQGTHRHAYNRLSTLKRMREIPYFGRIDFLEDGTSKAEKIYIGISTLTDESGENFLVYDWRAPISSVYYDYAPGPAEYDTPAEGVIHGVLEKKWQYTIHNGEIESMFDTTLTIGDEILQQVLGKGTAKHLHSIVATIQQEQNKIIRYDRGRLLIVHGVAGSGKTSAALQRVAYLLYKHREWLTADQIILFSPNEMFSNYVSKVLPELGEENMQQVTFQEYLNHRLSKEFQVEDPYEQLEYVLTATDSSVYETRVASIHFKASTIFFETIKAYGKSLEQAGMIFKGIGFRGKTIISAKQIAAQFYNTSTYIHLYSRLEKLTEWLMEQIDKLEKREWNKRWVEKEMELLTKEDYQKAYTYLEKKQKFTGESFDDYDLESKVLRRMIVRKKLKPLRRQIRKLRYIDVTGVYKQLFANPANIKAWIYGDLPKDWADICSLTVEVLEEGKLFYEDATPFLLLREVIEGFQINSAMKHVLVDEAQDYSAFQFEFLKRLFPAAKMTVLGDFNQAIFAHAGETDGFEMINDLYGEEETDVINLTRSYRSTKPIVEFTRGLIASGEQIIPFEREGEKPVLKQLSHFTELHHTIAKKVAELQRQKYNTIAIICQSAEESRSAYDALGNIEGIKLVKSNSTEYEQGVVVIPAYLAKGIEFDAVIIYNASADVYDNNSLRKLFYTACTRAMHHLQMYSIGEPSPFFYDVAPGSFVHER